MFLTLMCITSLMYFLVSYNIISNPFNPQYVGAPIAHKIKKSSAT